MDRRWFLRRTKQLRPQLLPTSSRVSTSYTSTWKEANAIKTPPSNDDYKALHLEFESAKSGRCRIASSSTSCKCWQHYGEVSKPDKST
eukprot:1138803-Pelagomonas_calceolata.AAC.1